MEWRKFFRRKKRETWTDLVRGVENDASTEELALLNTLRKKYDRKEKDNRKESA